MGPCEDKTSNSFVGAALVTSCEVASLKLIKATTNLNTDCFKAVHLLWFLLLAIPRRLFCFGSLVIIDVARCYLWLFTLYINTKIGKNSC